MTLNTLIIKQKQFYRMRRADSLGRQWRRKGQTHSGRSSRGRGLGETCLTKGLREGGSSFVVTASDQAVGLNSRAVASISHGCPGSEAQTQWGLVTSRLLSRSSGKECAPGITQVIGRTQFHVVVELRSPFPRRCRTEPTFTLW